MKKKSRDVAFTQFARFMTQPSLNKMGSGLVPRASLWHAYSKTSKLLSAKDCSINQVRARISNPENSLIPRRNLLDSQIFGHKVAPRGARVLLAQDS
jgi:hypothetical protein